jgi:hypothetical protein
MINFGFRVAGRVRRAREPAAAEVLVSVWSVSVKGVC